MVVVDDQHRAPSVGVAERADDELAYGVASDALELSDGTAGKRRRVGFRLRKINPRAGQLHQGRPELLEFPIDAARFVVMARLQSFGGDNGPAFRKLARARGALPGVQ